MRELPKIILRPLAAEDRESFIRGIQPAFKQAFVEKYGDDGTEVIPREDVEGAFEEPGAESYQILLEGRMVGGAVVTWAPETRRAELLLLYVDVDCHSRGIGQGAWRAIEARYQEAEVWETFTPYFDQRNLHFYVNKCGFHIVEYFHSKHPMPGEFEGDSGDGFFRFEKSRGRE